MRTNSLVDRLTGGFLVYASKMEPGFQEWISTVTPVKHRVAPVQQINHSLSNKVLVQSYSTKPSIRLLSPFKTSGLASTGAKNFEQTFKTTPTTHAQQYTFGTILPIQHMQASVLTNFFQMHNLFNPLRYKLFKICENASLVTYAQTVLNNPDNPDIILYQEPKLAVPLSFNELKKTNNIDNDSINFIEQDAPRLANELENFVLGNCSKDEVNKFGLVWLTKQVQKKLSSLEFEHEQRNTLFTSSLAFDSELNNDTKNEIIRLLNDKTDIK